MQQLRALIPEISWDLGLRVWHNFFSFPHPISTSPRGSVNEDESFEAEKSQSSAEENNLVMENQSDQTTDSATNQSETAEPDPKRIKESSWDPCLPAFRVTCYRSGKHIFQSPTAAANFGGEINNYFGWNVSMKKFDIEIILNIEQDHVYVSLALTRESLHRRNLTSFGPTTLRPTIAYNMLR